MGLFFQIKHTEEMTMSIPGQESGVERRKL